MTNYPIVDPAEIAKLPKGGVYLDANGHAAQKAGDGFFWHVLTREPMPISQLVERGGIAGRLVLEDEENAGVAAHAIAKRAEAEGQLETLAALTRTITRKVCSSRTGTIGEMGRCYLPQIPTAEMAPLLELLARIEDNDDAVDYVRWAAACSHQRDRAVELLRRVLGDLEHGPGGNEIDGATADLIGGFLAAQEANDE